MGECVRACVRSFSLAIILWSMKAVHGASSFSSDFLCYCANNSWFLWVANSSSCTQKGWFALSHPVNMAMGHPYACCPCQLGLLLGLRPPPSQCQAASMPGLPQGQLPSEAWASHEHGLRQPRVMPAAYRHRKWNTCRIWSLLSWRQCLYSP